MNDAIRALAFDLEGILTDGGALPSATLDILRDLRSRGLALMLLTDGPVDEVDRVVPGAASLCQAIIGRQEARGNGSTLGAVESALGRLGLCLHHTAAFSAAAKVSRW